MPWVSRATAMWPDSRYVASGQSYVNTSNNFAIVIAGCALRSVVIDHMIADSAKLVFASHQLASPTSGPIVLPWGISRLPVRRFPSKICAALALSRRLRLDGTGLPHSTVFMRVLTRPHGARCLAVCRPRWASTAAQSENTEGDKDAWLHLDSDHHFHRLERPKSRAGAAGQRLQTMRRSTAHLHVRLFGKDLPNRIRALHEKLPAQIIRGLPIPA